MRNFWAPLNLNVWKHVYGRKTPVLGSLADRSTTTIFKWNSGTGTFLWTLLSFTKQLFAVYLWKAVSVVILKFYFFLCEELEDNEDQRFNNYVNVTQFKKNTAKFHVMWKDILFAWSNSVWSFVQEKCL